ncbi:MAG: hypothetical protein IJ733_11785 [Lachnospiraceae bacterium]|nr:hypothetical protein [Lachnospiraceae bacterium]
MLGTMSEALDVIENRGIQIGLKQGIEQGILQGQTQGEDKLAKLIGILMEKGQNEEITLAISDSETRNRLYEKYDIHSSEKR